MAVAFSARLHNASIRIIAVSSILSFVTNAMLAASTSSCTFSAYCVTAPARNHSCINSSDFNCCTSSAVGGSSAPGCRRLSTSANCFKDAPSSDRQVSIRVRPSCAFSRCAEIHASYCCTNKLSTSPESEFGSSVCFARPPPSTEWITSACGSRACTSLRRASADALCCSPHTSSRCSLLSFSTRSAASRAELSCESSSPLDSCPRDSARSLQAASRPDSACSTSVMAESCAGLRVVTASRLLARPIRSACNAGTTADSTALAASTPVSAKACAATAQRLSLSALASASNFASAISFIFASSSALALASASALPLASASALALTSSRFRCSAGRFSASTAALSCCALACALAFHFSPISWKVPVFRRSLHCLHPNRSYLESLPSPFVEP
mmetsp:Transcript_29070/g.69632  ORF Transcript_29070/g.69632 Transcript_29070/m.69632 type:complete len:389 (-) Transcript_29070:443-1609(-)